MNSNKNKNNKNINKNVQFHTTIKKNNFINNTNNNNDNNRNKQKNKNLDISDIVKMKNSEKDSFFMFNTPENKKTIQKINYLDFPQINNKISSLSITDGNIKDISFFNNIHFSNKVLNHKNKELPIKEIYYNLFKLKSFKKEELLNNNENEIPIITNSSKSHSIPNPQSPIPNPQYFYN